MPAACGSRAAIWYIVDGPTAKRRASEQAQPGSQGGNQGYIWKRGATMGRRRKRNFLQIGRRRRRNFLLEEDRAATCSQPCGRRWGQADSERRLQQPCSSFEAVGPAPLRATRKASTQARSRSSALVGAWSGTDSDKGTAAARHRWLGWARAEPCTLRPGGDTQ